jgi:hypothetical protein
VTDDSATSELAILASIADVSVNTFLRNIVLLQRRGLVQARGKWRAILPHAISNRLALKAMESYPQHFLVTKLVDDAPSRVAQSFSRRIGYLHESERARGIAGTWLQTDGFLGNVARLDEVQIQILRNVAPISQRATLSAIERCISEENFTAISNKSRSQFGRLLRSLAYEQPLFHGAATALMLFALREPLDYRTDSVRDMMKSLFYSHLSGTQALPAQRGAFIKGLLLSNQVAKQKLALTLLQAGLESNHFTSHYSFDFGALQRTYGWSPRTLADVHNWYGLMIGIMVELGKIPSETGADARRLLGASFRGLWVKAGVKQNLIDAVDELGAIDGWPDGWIAIRTTLHWDKERLDAASLKELTELERKLAPRDLIATIRAKVLSRGAFNVDLDEDPDIDGDAGSAIASYKRAQESAERLGKAAALDGEALSDLKPFLTADRSTDKLWYFGHGIGLAASSVTKIMDCIKPIVRSLQVGDLNPLFIHGIVRGWNEVSPAETSLFLDAALNDETWGPILPQLQIAAGIDAAAYDRLLLSLKSDQTPSWQFHHVGGTTDAFTVEQIGALINLAFERADNGPQVAIDVLSMVILCAAQQTLEYQEELRRYCADAISTLDWSALDLSNSNMVRHIRDIVSFGFSGDVSHEKVAISITRMVEPELSGNADYPRRLGDVLVPFLKNFPNEALDAIYGFKESLNVRSLLATQLDSDRDSSLAAVPDTAFAEWCKISPDDRCPFAAAGCKLFTRRDQVLDAEVVGICRAAADILYLASDRKKVLNILLSRFVPSSWSGSRAAIMRQRLSYIDELNPFRDIEVFNLIEGAKISFAQAIAREEEWEYQREKDDTGSFE